jgi:hypothetical protein
MATTLAERVAALETRMAHFERGQNSMDSKLDDLLALRNKGAGAFWLATALAGVGAVSIFFQITSWIGGLFQ